MARLPVPGKVKSRLAASLGEEQAALFYKLCSEQVLSAVGQLPSSVHKYLFCADESGAREAGAWAGAAFKTVVQQGADIGERLVQALTRAFAEGAVKTLAVATDVPDLTASIVRTALQALQKSDLVLGPCFDGGYYLIGMNGLRHQLFSDIPWSTGYVTSSTLKQAEKLRLSVKQLQTLWDIDSETDLKAWSISGLSPQDNPLNRFVRSLHLADIANAAKDSISG